MAEVKHCTLHVLSFFIAVLLSNGVSSASMTIENFVYGSCTSDPSDILLWDRTYVQCLNECRARVLCMAVSMHVRARLCRLYVGLPDAMVTNDECSGFVFSKKRDWTQDIMPECSDVSCLTGQTCDVDALSRSAACSYKECPKLEDQSGIKILGNSRAVGSRITYLCNSLASILGNTVRTCMPDDGQWNGTAPTCIIAPIPGDTAGIPPSYEDMV